MNVFATTAANQAQLVIGAVYRLGTDNKWFVHTGDPISMQTGIISRIDALTAHDAIKQRLTKPAQP